VNALDNALRKALLPFFPALEKHAPGRLQGAHHRRRQRHGGQDPRAHHQHRWQRHLEHRRCELQHHRRKLAALVDGIEYFLSRKAA
jgi:hypothetical protein